MRILHTSDWHLGVSLEQAPRHEEHVRFVAWLIDTIESDAIDVLVIAGDVYHYMQPSAAAQSLFYAFLAKCRDTRLRAVVMVAGNHDSPSRFDAPRQVLGALDMSVVGSLPDDLASCLVPVRLDDGVEVVIAAVPYISESRLGVGTTERTKEAVRQDYEDRFASLYRALADHAESLYPGIPLVGTGHMTVAARGETSREGDFVTPIHSFLSISGLSPEVFDPRYAYVALGHIHRQHQVGSSVAWYSGTPVPTNVVEARSPRYVLRVDVDVDEPVRVRPRKVPRWRDIFELVGDEDTLLDLIDELTWDSEFPPYLYVTLELNAPTSLGVDRFRRQLARRFGAEERPRIVSFKKTLLVEELEPEPHVELDELEPEDVFCRMFVQRYELPPDDRMLAAFRSLLSEEGE